MIRHRAIGAALAATALVACSVDFHETVHGSGTHASELRAVGAFDGIVVSGGLEVRVAVGAGPLLAVEGDDNLLEYVEAEVEGDRLVLRVRPGYRLVPTPRVDVHVGRLAAFELSGSGDVEIEGARGEALRLAISGSGILSADGEVESLELSIAGSGEIEVSELRAVAVQVRVDGSGDVRCYAEKDLGVRIAGSGNVVYRGEPTVTKSIAGSGDVRPAWK